MHRQLKWGRRSTRVYNSGPFVEAPLLFVKRTGGGYFIPSIWLYIFLSTFISPRIPNDRVPFTSGGGLRCSRLLGQVQRGRWLAAVEVSRPKYSKRIRSTKFRITEINYSHKNYDLLSNVSSGEIEYSPHVIDEVIVQTVTRDQI